MTILGKLGSILVHAVIPKKLRTGFDYRVKKTYDALHSNLELTIFWRILFFPIVLPLSLLFGIFKMLLIWLMPKNRYNDLVYIFKEMYNDVVLRRIGFFTAIKRARLRNELFTKGGEKKKSYGDKNPDITFYVIRPYYFLEPNALIYRNVANLLTQYYYVLQKLSYATEHGYVPVIDWERYGKLPHAEDYPINGTSNSWEYYWTQPSDYSLEEVYQSKNVILSTQNIGQFGYIPNCAMTPPFNTYAKKLVNECPKYLTNVHLNDTTQAYVDKAYNDLFPESGRVLGVVVRGSSYGNTGTPYHSHPMQVSMGELMKTVHRCMEEWELEKVFFVNEMQELVETMKEEFDDKLIVLPRMRDTFERPADGITKNPMYYDGNRYQTNLDYVTEVALLARCTSIIGSMSSGMRTALIWNNNEFEHVHVFEKGLW